MFEKETLTENDTRLWTILNHELYKNIEVLWIMKVATKSPSHPIIQGEYLIADSLKVLLWGLEMIKYSDF